MSTERVSPEAVLWAYPRCVTVEPGTAMPCRCQRACDNYALRANGYTAQEMLQPEMKARVRAALEKEPGSA